MTGFRATYLLPAAIAAPLLADPCMQPLLTPEGFAAAVQEAHPTMQAEAERLMAARIGVVKLLNGLDPFDFLWVQQLPEGQGHDPGPLDIHTAELVHGAKSLGQVSVLNAELCAFHLGKIAAADPLHPLAQHWRLFREACTPMGQPAPDWPELEALGIKPVARPSPSGGGEGTVDAAVAEA